jgi:hypothetical protein
MSACLAGEGAGHARQMGLVYRVLSGWGHLGGCRISKESKHMGSQYVPTVKGASGSSGRREQCGVFARRKGFGIGELGRVRKTLGPTSRTRAENAAKVAMSLDTAGQSR